MMDKDNKELVLKKLEHVLQKLECPMCHYNQFIIADGFIQVKLYQKYNLIDNNDNKSIPAVAIICKHCGFISNHAIGILGLLNQNEEIKQEMNDEKWLKAAIYWIKDMANPNEGMSHPLDDDKLKSIANLIASLNVKINEQTITDYAHSLGIVDESINLIIQTFKEAKLHKYNILGRFPEDFLRLRLRDIAKDRLGD